MSGSSVQIISGGVVAIAPLQTTDNLPGSSKPPIQIAVWSRLLGDVHLQIPHLQQVYGLSGPHLVYSQGHHLLVLNLMSKAVTHSLCRLSQGETTGSVHMCGEMVAVLRQRGLDDPSQLELYSLSTGIGRTLATGHLKLFPVDGAPHLIGTDMGTVISIWSMSDGSLQATLDPLEEYPEYHSLAYVDGSYFGVQQGGIDVFAQDGAFEGVIHAPTGSSIQRASAAFGGYSMVVKNAAGCTEIHTVAKGRTV